MSDQGYSSQMNRRQLLLRGGAGFGALALCDLLGNQLFAVDQLSTSRAQADIGRLPVHQPTAKSVIFVFLEGGPSQIDLFDPKPELTRRSGQQVPVAAIADCSLDNTGVGLRVSYAGARVNSYVRAMTYDYADADCSFSSPALSILRFRTQS